ncbi:MAG: homoserine dehydrogenase [Clostridia bacterium]|nr:homoserine dehydrogenase [Clostridia bacterium]
MHKIAILGFGVVGSGVAEALGQDADRLESRLGTPIEIKYILDLRTFPDHPLGDRVIHDFNRILEDPEIELVAEMMGGSHPAYDFTRACLEAGKHVVTSNKEVVANFGVELLELARANRVRYLFEASVGGGIPVLRTLIDEITLHRIHSVCGILNGTTNYILTSMQKDGLPFDAALRSAQQNGFAEANPAADLQGLDAARKTAILCALAYGVLPPVSSFPVTGIEGITDEHLSRACAAGGTLKLVGCCEKAGDRLLVSVQPVFLPLSHPLAHIAGVLNGILIRSDVLGQILVEGPGAGKLPTASAVVRDMADVFSGRAQSQDALKWRAADKSSLADPEKVLSLWVDLGRNIPTFAPEPMTKDAFLRRTGADRRNVFRVLPE